MIKKLQLKRRAVTLTELLVVLAIIALLATIAVPVYVQQLQRAKIAVAQSEVREIADSMQQAAITHGFLVPIHALDNIPDTSSNTGQAIGNTTSRDDFNNMNLNNNFVIDVSIPLINQRGTGNQETLDSDNQKVRRMVNNWQGPFLNPTRVRFGGEDPDNPAASVRIYEDYVVDPWGNPYRVYSPFGLLGSDTRTPVQANFEVTEGMSNMFLSTGAPEQDRFDRFAIVSYGPDGDTGFDNNPAFQGDDLYYAFSVGVLNESFFDVF